VVYESTYQGPTINALLDVSAYTTGNSTTTVRALITACLAALIDSAWSIVGMTTVGATMEMSGSGFRSLTQVVAGQIVRGRQFTLRVIAEKN
jgi:acyl-coenzyme A thioesterase PaaI-like protein